MHLMISNKYKSRGQKEIKICLLNIIKDIIYKIKLYNHYKLEMIIFRECSSEIYK